MLIVMCGLPKSGKSTLVDMLSNQLPFEIVRPEHPDDIEKWFKEFNKAPTLLYQNRNKTVVIDTCGATPSLLEEAFTMAAIRSHNVLVIYVDANEKDCVERSSEEVIEKYISKLKSAVLEYKSRYRVELVLNTGGIENLQKEADRIIGIICQINGAGK